MWEKLHCAAFCGLWSHRAWEKSLKGHDVFSITNTSTGGADYVDINNCEVYTYWNRHFKHVSSSTNQGSEKQTRSSRGKGKQFVHSSLWLCKSDGIKQRSYCTNKFSLVSRHMTHKLSCEQSIHVIEQMLRLSYSVFGGHAPSAEAVFVLPGEP